MIVVRTSAEIDRIRECGALNAKTHREVSTWIQPGITTLELNDAAAKFIHAVGAKSSIREGFGFPGDICVSVNEEVGHGVPSKYMLKNKDIVKIDISLEYGGFHTDCAMTYIVGHGTKESRHLVETTQQALTAGIGCAKPPRPCSDMSSAIYEVVRKNGYAVVRYAFGHGIGTNLHEAPSIANFGSPNYGPRLRPGMVIAIEPVVTAGCRFIFKDKNGWTDVTADKSISAHFEHTVLITDGNPEILTQTQNPLFPPMAVHLSDLVYRDMVTGDRPLLLNMAAEQMDHLLMHALGRKVHPGEIFDPKSEIVVLEHEPEGIIGFFALVEQGQSLHLNTLVIGASFQGKGFGKQVMRKIEGMAFMRSMKNTTLCVQTNNTRALQLYDRLGYEVVGEAGPNTLRMKKSVAG